MDSMNVRNAERIVGHKGNNKVKKLLEFASRTDDVAEPWYTDRFDITYNDVLEGCNAFYEYLEQNKMILNNRIRTKEKKNASINYCYIC